MSKDINSVALVGRFTKKAELRHTPNGAAVADFSIAVGDSYTTKEGEKKETVSFINCSIWGKPAENLVAYTDKGHRIGIIGKLKQSTWTDKDGGNRSSLSVTVESFQFLQPKGEGQPAEGEPSKFEDAKPFNPDDVGF